MSLLWQVKIHKLVLSEDFKTISPSDQRLILNAIRKKLTVDPHNYGKPLRGELKGYWRLRIRDYRAIYKIRADTVEVLVIKVGVRKDERVYRELFYRIKRLKD